MEIYEQYILVPNLSRTADLVGGTDILDQRAHGASGLMICVHVATAGASTLTLRIFGKEPFGGNYYQVNVDVALVAGRNVVFVSPGVSKQPPGESASTLSTNVKQVVGIPIPDVWNVSFIKGDASAWTYGAIAQRIP
jgi:hypothetical protein